MITSSSTRAARYGVAFDKYAFAKLIAVLIVAVLVRIVFFSGASGSDDVVYVSKGLDLLQGNWTVSNYVGAQRYGVHIPMAVFMYVFGTTTFTSNLWPLVASIGEIVLMWWFAMRMYGSRIAWLCALIIATLPLHVNFAGRLLADAPLALFISATFAFFIIAESTRKRRYYVLAGIAVGLTFWVKPSVTPLLFPVFLVYVAYLRAFRREWLWLVASAASVAASYWILLATLSGDPWFVVNTRIIALDKSVFSLSKDFSPWTYFHYLFVDVKHTFLLGPLAALGLIFMLRSHQYRRVQADRWVALWAIGLLAILSFTVISLSPIRLIPKQSNYILIFVAPFSLLAAIAIAEFPRAIRYLLIIAVCSGGVVLSGLEQQAVRVFTANSVAAEKFAEEQQPIRTYSMRQAVSLSYLAARLKAGGRDVESGNVRSLPNIEPRTFPPLEIGPDESVFFVLDMETADWSGDLSISPQTVPGCWKEFAKLTPTAFGLGERLLWAIREASSIGPSIISEKITHATDVFYRPRPATVYRISGDCRIDLERY
jgi:4-amino-4-deoxy-L-arabinose transferase-like glycosyltransferase